jgi:hypothetical protein
VNRGSAGVLLNRHGNHVAATMTRLEGDAAVVVRY